VAVHVSFGGQGELERLPRYSAGRLKPPLWTLARSAAQDDTVIFYIKSPTASFVATGRVLDSRRKPGDRHGFPGQQMGRVGDISMLPRTVRLRDAAAAVPAWKWLTQPHQNITVPQEHEAVFLDVLGSPPAPRSEPAVKALENLRLEATVLSRSRNRGLRDAVITASAGVCAACGTDYSAVEPARWSSVLQAHHKRPLHEFDGPVENTTTDLVALCPTCHVLAHLGRGAPRSASAVRQLLRRRTTHRLAK